MTSIAGLVLLLVIGIRLYARHWLVLAGRSRVGARSEDEVQRPLARLETEGWRLRHSLPWRGRGDSDSVAIAPTGVAFAIETSSPNVRRASPGGRARDGTVALPSPAAVVSARALRVLRVEHARGLERIEGGVLIVSLDRLMPALIVAAGLSKRRAFLAGV